MTFEERIIPKLSLVAHELVDIKAYGPLESIANFLSALKDGNWRVIPPDEQIYWLSKMQGLLGPRGLGDSWMLGDTTLSECLDIVDAELAGIKRAI
jgi:hypothetical protein